MAVCETCGNHYDKAIEISVSGGSAHIFDSFECAIQALAPQCARCKCRIVGHGLESKGSFYCSGHCAQEAGIEGLRDRV